LRGHLVDDVEGRINPAFKNWTLAKASAEREDPGDAHQFGDYRQIAVLTRDFSEVDL
jgi:hypothetical protein